VRQCLVVGGAFLLKTAIQRAATAALLMAWLAAVKAVPCAARLRLFARNLQSSRALAGANLILQRGYSTR
jgi:hypothetical protein